MDHRALPNNTAGHIEMPVQVGVEQDGEHSTGVEHVKRPMNAFMVWAKTERRQLAMRLPGMPNSEVSKILGDMWRRLPDEQKAKYRSESEQIRRKHKKEHPDYRYHPKRQSRKNKALDTESALANSLIQSGKMQHQQRPLTPSMSNPSGSPRMAAIKDDSRPHSAPPDYHENSMMPVHTLQGPVNAAALSSVSTWWSPASTPPTSNFTSSTQAQTLNLSGMSTQFQSSLPASPSSQDVGGGSLSASSSSAWLKANSPADSSSSKTKSSSPCLMAQQPPRRHSQSPLVSAVASPSRLATTSYSGTVPMTTMPTSGSLLPAAVSGAYYDKNSSPYLSSEQPSTPLPGTPRFTSLAVGTPRVTKPDAVAAATTYETSAPLVSEARDSVIAAPGTVFYPAYQPTTAYLPQPTAYGWLDNRTHFVLPDQISSTQHSQVYQQQSVAS